VDNDSADYSVQPWGPIHRQCHKIYLMICLRTIAAQKLRYPKMIIRDVSEVNSQNLS